MFRLIAIIVLALGGLTWGMRWGAAVAVRAQAASVTPTNDVLPTPPPFQAPTTTSSSVPVSPTASPTPTRSPAPTPTVTATPPIGARPDACEENDERAQACAIAAEGVAGPFSLFPVGDPDWYQIDLGAANGLATTITVRATAGLDLLTSLSRSDGTPLVRFASPVISTTLAPDITGVVLLHVENRAPEDPSDQSYTIEVRRDLPVLSTARDDQVPDRLENNWDPAHAVPIAVGYVYDELNFVCPERGGCQGGDIDWYRVTVKARQPYVVAAFDAGAGVDPVTLLFWGSETVPVAANDDAGPLGVDSLLYWTAPSDGEVLLQVAPRTGGLNPHLDDAQASTYRLAVAVAGSTVARTVTERVTKNTLPPTPTPRPTTAGSGGSGGNSAPAVSPAPVAPASAGASSNRITGQALVVVEQTALRVSPGERAELLQMLPEGTVVLLQGVYAGSWVQVHTLDGVLPGWIHGPDLRRVPATPDDAEPSGTEPTSAGVSPASEGTTTALPAPAGVPTPPVGDGTPDLVVRPLGAAPAPPPPAPPVRTTLTISVTVVAATSAPLPTRTSSRLSPTPTLAHPLPRIRVQLVDAFGNVLAEGVTNAAGQVALTQEVTAGLALFARLPAPGIQVPIDPTQPAITLALPIGATP